MFPQHMVGPTQIVLNMTNRCNQRCRYCFNSSTVEEIAAELTDDEVDGIVAYFIDDLRPHNVCFTGGEPLLRKDLVVRSVAALADAGIRTNLLTNGLLLDAATLADLVAAGIGEIQVSLDGPDADTHEAMRGPRTFAGAIGALEALRDSGYGNYLACMTLSSHNWNRVAEMIELMRVLRSPVLHLRPWLPFGRAARYASRVRMSPAQARSVRRIVREHEAARDPVQILFADPLSQIYALKQGQPMFGMEISSRGDFVLSPYIKRSFGNVREQSIDRAWRAGWWGEAQKRMTLDLLDEVLYGADPAAPAPFAEAK